MGWVLAALADNGSMYGWRLNKLEVFGAIVCAVRRDLVASCLRVPGGGAQPKAGSLKRLRTGLPLLR